MQSVKCALLTYKSEIFFDAMKRSGRRRWLNMTKLSGVDGLVVVVQRYRSVAIAVIDIDRSVAFVVGVEDVGVAVSAPPLTQLPVPRARKNVEELFVLHADEGEKVLVAEVSLEVVFGSETVHRSRFDQLIVERRGAHLGQVEEQHAAVEAGQAVGRRRADACAHILAAILPQEVAIDWLGVARYADDVGRVEGGEVSVELADVGAELEVGIEQYDALDARLEHLEEADGEEEERVAVVRRRTVGEVALHLSDQIVHFARQLVRVYRYYLNFDIRQTRCEMRGEVQIQNQKKKKYFY